MLKIMCFKHNFSKFIILIYVGLCVFAHLGTKALHTEEGLELIFRERTHSDWRDVWHHETHSRCRDKLLRHLFWACEKDIYRLTRRNNKRSHSNHNNNNNIYKSNNIDNNDQNNNESVLKQFQFSLTGQAWFLNENNLPKLLRTRRSSALSITNECCTKSGCTWEEYAEYCSSNKRRMHY